ncbi:DNA polymerase Y family protein [Thalassotalea maritima]|uniref:Y-family DNA polymerase n=1 Tax=Thalassotalea maritima TaxID=3242416 RepID=UPI0035291360
MTLWLYLHFPSLQLDSLYANNEQTPIIIVDEKKYHVLQANNMAHEKGIQLGMGLGSAATLAQNLQVIPYNRDLEYQRLTRIARWLYLLSADICVYPPDGILLKVSNMLTLYHDLARYWEAISEHLEAMSVRFHYACGYSVYSAILLAKHNAALISDDKHLIEQKLAQLPLTLTGLASSTLQSLQRLGISHMSQLLGLSLSEIAKRFDIELVNYIGQLTGQLQHPVTFYHPDETFQHHLDLWFEVTNCQRLQKPLEKVYRLLQRFLSLRDQCCHQLQLMLHFRDVEHPPLCIDIHSAKGEYRADKWLALSELRLQSVYLPAPIIAIEVRVLQVHGNDYQVMDLLQHKHASVSVADLVSRLSAKLGQASVRGINVVDDHRPEQALQYGEPLQRTNSLTHHNVPQGIKKSNKPQLSQTTILPQLDASLRPLLLLNSPLPLHEHVSIEHGPERIVSGWWDDDMVCRDYFVAVTCKGQWLWVYRTPEHEWFVHGVFS